MTLRRRMESYQNGLSVRGSNRWLRMAKRVALSEILIQLRGVVHEGTPTSGHADHCVEGAMRRKSFENGFMASSKRWDWDRHHEHEEPKEVDENDAGVDNREESRKVLAMYCPVNGSCRSLDACTSNYARCVLLSPESK